jgi:hypothetical protein
VLKEKVLHDTRRIGGLEKMLSAITLKGKRYPPNRRFRE